MKQLVTESDNCYVIKIPNQEVQQEFQNLTAYYLNVAGIDLAVLYSALKRRKKEDFINKYQKITLDLPSYYDLKNENSYHMMMLGMCAWLSGKYEIISNREESKGRCNIILKARAKNRASYIFEFKYLKSENNVNKEELSKVAKQAVEQIIDKQYAAGLSGKVIYISLAHHIKDVCVEWLEDVN